ncbi:MAG TPA: phage tail assembly protein [Chloroflexi bacterium]|nr:phage tail assembly protein [Chloroflexota bacterium]
MELATEVEFMLPRGYTDDKGQLHRRGRMRMATAKDEIVSVSHPWVQENEVYLPIVLLSQVVVQLGTLAAVTPEVIEGLFAVDLAYLEDLYMRLNSYQGMDVQARCPYCNRELHLRLAPANPRVQG